ncbi:MAG: cyclic nucleotide-binding domain-containing protein [Planctomycetota bacterium]|jgi:CRP-like cAMP-binding protein
MTKRLTLTATNTRLCKVFSDGQRVCFQGREVMLSLSNACCAFQTNNIRNLMAVLEKSKKPEWAIKALLPKPFFCMDYDCAAQFSVATDEEDDLHPVAANVNALPGKAADISMNDAVQGNSTLAESNAEPFLQRLPADLSRALLDAGVERQLQPGEVPLQQGQKGDCLYVIKSGLVVIEKDMPEGNKVELARLGSGETFGEMSLLSGENCNASVRVMEESIVTAISGEDLDNVMCTNPTLHRFFGHLFIERLKATNVKLEEELQRGMNGRLSMISLMDLLQSLLMSRLTGKFQLKRSSEAGQLYIEEGQVKSAQLGELIAEDAFKEMAKWHDGVFCFQPGSQQDISANINVATMQLLMNAALEYDEERR